MDEKRSGTQAGCVNGVLIGDKVTLNLSFLSGILAKVVLEPLSLSGQHFLDVLTLTLSSLNRVFAALCDVCCLPNISFSLMTKKSSMFVCKDLLPVGLGISLFPDPHLYCTWAQIHWSHRVPELFRAETFT